MICLAGFHLHHDFHLHKAFLHDQIRKQEMATEMHDHHGLRPLSLLDLIVVLDIHRDTRTVPKTLHTSHTTDLPDRAIVLACWIVMRGLLTESMSQERGTMTDDTTSVSHDQSVKLELKETLVTKETMLEPRETTLDLKERRGPNDQIETTAGLQPIIQIVLNTPTGREETRRNRQLDAMLQPLAGM